MRMIRSGRTPFTDESGELTKSQQEIVTYVHVPRGYKLVPEQLTSTMELIFNTSKKEGWPAAKTWQMILETLPKYILAD